MSIVTHAATYIDGLAASEAPLEEMTTHAAQEGWWQARRCMGVRVDDLIANLDIHHTTMNTDAVKIESGNSGEYHRALVIAREMLRVRMWNGQDVLTIYSPSQASDKVFGISHHPATSLQFGIDYQIAENR